MRHLLVLSFVAVLATLIAVNTSFAQAFPAPLGYWDFEDGAGTEASDKSGNGHTGFMTGQNNWVAGAPGAASPGGGLEFADNGFLNVNSFDMPSTISAAGKAYTMSFWLKPTAGAISGGDEFFLGQSNQGIHNGMRRNGRIEQAHWGADHAAETVLTPDEWAHGAITWDGTNELGDIFLNGVRDIATQAKRAPNGNGHLQIGTRSNDPNVGFHGVLDEIVIWDSVLTDEQIGALAAGANPIVPEPSSIILAGLGLLSLVGCGFRRRKRA